MNSESGIFNEFGRSYLKGLERGVGCSWSYDPRKGVTGACDTPGEHCAPCDAERDWMTRGSYGISGRPGPVREIKDMQVGESGYEVPGALVITKELRGELKPHFNISPTVCGAVSMMITRTKTGYKIGPPSFDFEWKVRGSIKGDITVDRSTMPRVATLQACLCSDCRRGGRRSIRDLDIGEMGWVEPLALTNGWLNPHYQVVTTGGGVAFNLKVTRLDECFWLDKPPGRGTSHKAQLTACSCTDCKNAPAPGRLPAVVTAPVDYTIKSVTTLLAPTEPRVEPPKPKPPVELADYLNDEDKAFFKFTDELAGIGKELEPVAETPAPVKKVERKLPRDLRWFLLLVFVMITVWTVVYWTFLAVPSPPAPAPVLPAVSTVCSQLQPFADGTSVTPEQQKYQDEYKELCR
jgi:hypothetical protein